MTEPSGAPRAAEWIAENDTLLLLHGFPTWSYDHAEMASDLARDR
jgi:hypothetical protein